ncbi:hypothetical protein Asppvi_000715 [Aspergillus pseudoviridinutans]|uniref:Uncharacterized protein n=1 Tax=Aspergillus pseudoviridinutans TaxID=1517512 RepID=A0A9P3EPB9_9EURO|nr:uncharacterized protein Asppvi_000715 [Aspergillus pseudoviridinutans]GIJ82209.1 hypothetical protein Asppvi_000715 [Aspergillus pseudoviridinutans]
MSDNNTSKKAGQPSTSTANESTLQPRDDVRLCPHCLPSDPSPGLSLSVTTSVDRGGTRYYYYYLSTRLREHYNTRPGDFCRGAHIWHYSGGSATVVIQIPAAVVETLTVAIQAGPLPPIIPLPLLLSGAIPPPAKNNQERGRIRPKEGEDGEEGRDKLESKCG